MLDGPQWQTSRTIIRYLLTLRIRRVSEVIESDVVSNTGVSVPSIG